MEEDIYKIRVDNNFRQAAGDANALGASIEQITTSTNENNQAVQQGAQAQQSFRAQLREANLELQRQIQLTGESSAETIAAARAVAGLRDQMEFASQIADTFNPDQQMRALGAATQIAGTGLQGVTSGMALFGDQSADTQEQLLKVQAAMAFSDAISNLSNLGDQWQLLKAAITSNTIVQKANTAATGVAAMVQNLFTGSVNASSNGFKLLKIAIASTGIGLLVVGIAAVVANFDKFKKLMSDIGWLKAVGETISNIVNAVTDFVGLTSESERVIDKQKKDYEKAIAQNEKYLERNASTLSEARKKEIELSNEHFKRVAEGRFSNEESLKILREAKNKEEIDANKKHDKELSDIAKKKHEKELAEKIQEENEKKSLEKTIRQAVQDLQDKSEEQKLARQKQRDIDEIKALEKKGVDVREALRLNTEKYNILENELKAKRAQELKEADEARDKELRDIDIESTEKRQAKEEEEGKAMVASIEYNYEKSKKDKEQKAKDEIETAKNIQDSIASITQSGVNAIESLEALGLKKSKASQAIKKGMALTQIASDSATAISKAIPMALEAGKEAASIAGPAAPVVGPIVTAASLAGSFALVAKNVATAKTILGAGGGGASIGTSGGATPQAPPTVAFNNTAENQIGQSVARSQGEQAPIQVVVAESDITNAQNNVKVLVGRNKI